MRNLTTTETASAGGGFDFAVQMAIGPQFLSAIPLLIPGLVASVFGNGIGFSGGATASAMSCPAPDTQRSAGS